MEDVMKELYETILGRKTQPMEGSYTCYLFEQGLDKILKKCGEECSEAIIAAKNLEAAASAEASTGSAAANAADAEAGASAEASTTSAPAPPAGANAADAEAGASAEASTTSASAPPAGQPALAPLRADLENEVCDLLYHLTVMLVHMGIPLENIEGILKARSAKIGNLKPVHASDHDS